MISSTVATPATSRSPGSTTSYSSSRDGKRGILSALGHLFGWLQRRTAQETWHEVRLALGKRMVAAGIDDGVLGTAIGELEQRIRTVRAMRGSTDALESARTELILRLADLAMEDDAPLPGAETEYHRAREVRTALAHRETGLGHDRVQPAKLAHC